MTCAGDETDLWRVNTRHANMERFISQVYHAAALAVFADDKRGSIGTFGERWHASELERPAPTKSRRVVETEIIRISYAEAPSTPLVDHA